MEDSINVWLYTRQNLRNEQFARRILQLLYSTDEPFAPEYLSIGDRWKRVDLDDVDQLSRWWPKQINISLERRSTFESAVAISMGRVSSGRYSSLSFWLTTDYLQLPNGLRNLLEFSIALYGLLSPAYGNIHPTKDALAMRTVDDPKYGKTILPTDLKKGLAAVYWGNFFGPAYVSLIGRESLLQLSGYRKTELGDGGLLILTTRTPLELDHDVQNLVKNEIGGDYFYEWGKNTPGRVPE